MITTYFMFIVGYNNNMNKYIITIVNIIHNNYTIHKNIIIFIINVIIIFIFIFYSKL